MYQQRQVLAAVGSAENTNVDYGLGAASNTFQIRNNALLTFPGYIRRSTMNCIVVEVAQAASWQSCGTPFVHTVCRVLRAAAICYAGRFLLQHFAGGCWHGMSGACRLKRLLPVHAHCDPGY